ncbi:sugar O-acetyltransferase [Anaerocolumna jejuensis]|uniref:sugar O-acetyltransferase n=1 Tax=Anaerocolumna jejuensis TaxID=259063 RepID=UPI003F7BC82B
MYEEEKILAGKLFCPGDPQLKAIKLKTHNLNVDYNATYENESEKRELILRQMIGELGQNCFMHGPIYFHYGKHTKIGDNFFANFNFTVQDDAIVTIGDDCNFGPNVTIVTPIHPMLPNERNEMMTASGEKKKLCYAKPVTIGNNCWLGAGVIVCSGASIGENCVIGAGSVVTKNIPAKTFAAGVPCRVIREITEKDSMVYQPDILSDNTVINNE